MRLPALLAFVPAIAAAQTVVTDISGRVLMTAKGLTRREMIRGAASAGSLCAAASVGGLLTVAPIFRVGAQDSAVPLPQLTEFRRLLAANRILARENVVDAFGHVSVRDPRDAERYVMSRSRSPELVELDDLMVFQADGAALDARGRTPYGERFIHGAIYAARPDVNAVVHNHSYAVLPFTVSSTRLRPMIHMASVIGAEVPVWDIRDEFGETDMLVRDMAQGDSLAAALGDRTCVLMRGHGAVVAAAGVREAVLISFYLQVNAQVQMEALGLGELTPLSDAEIELSGATQFSPLAIDRAWEYFCLRAGVDPV